MYESVKQSVANYNDRQKLKETEEDKSVFRWKFVVIGLGIVLIVLVGLLSEILKSISSHRLNKYDTSFMYSLLEDSTFVKTTTDIGTLLYGLNASEGIVYDHADKVYYSSFLDAANLIETTAGRKNLLYFLNISDGTDTHRFGMYLQAPYSSDQARVIQKRDHKVSSIFSLDSPSRMRLNMSDECSIYIYGGKQKSLTLLQLFTFSASSRDNQVMTELGNYRCFGRTGAEAVDNIFKVTGMNVGAQGVGYLSDIEVYQLSRENKGLLS